MGLEFDVIDSNCTLGHYKYLAAGNLLDACVEDSRLTMSKRDQDKVESGNETPSDEQPSVIPSDILQLGGRATVSCRELKYS